MAELRKDYLIDRYVIVAPKRGERPHQFNHSAEQNSVNNKLADASGVSSSATVSSSAASSSYSVKSSPSCFFCQGNESQTPPEIYRLSDGKNWKMRVFPNKFSAVDGGDPSIKTHNEFFTFADAVGSHEVLVETNDHSKQLWDLSVDDMFNIFKTYVMRIKELERRENVKYVAVFKNHGKDAGTSIMHSHSQIVAYNLVPVSIQREEDAVKTYAKANSCCAFCKIINVEKTSYRRVFENQSFVSFTPYASRLPYELWFFPKRHVISVKELSDSEIKDLCEMLKKALTKLKAMDASYNMYLHNGSGSEKNFHFHVELLPRVATWAGFELGTDTYILSVSPEDAAEYYRS